MEDKKQLKEELLSEVIRIGDWLLEKSKIDATGLYWECATMDMKRIISWTKGEGIYSGVSGISLFLLMLHKITGRDKYLTAAKDSLHWVIDYCTKSPNPFYSLFTGRMGVPFVLLKMAEFTGDSHWLEKALEIARPCISVLEGPQPVDDLINGTSGNIIVLLHLHAAAKEKWLADTAALFAEHLIKSAYQAPRGIYWDRSHNTISGLCGFSHGAAGIGWTFLELAHYFQNEAFYRLAQQAFHYETSFFNNTMNNWEDLRKGIYIEEDEESHRKEYLKNNMEFFTKGTDMNAWCHGAAGIGLSRLRAYELFKNMNNPQHELYLNEAMTAIEKTINTDIEMENSRSLFILCHGGGGNAELFLRAYETLKDEKYLSLAEQLARKALAGQKKLSLYLSGYRGVMNSNNAGENSTKEEEDTSLFMGSTGVGYFFLRVLAPNDVPSILIPTVDEASSLSYPLTLPELGKKLLNKYFSRSITLSEKLCHPELTRFFNDNPLDINAEPLKKSFITFMEKTIQGIPSGQQNCFSDAFILEREKSKMDEAIPSHSYLEIKNKVLREQAEKLIALDPDDFLNLKLILEPTIQIATTEWDWSFGNENEWFNNMGLEPDIFPVLLKPMPQKIIEESLSPMSYTILGGFEGGNTVAGVQKLTIEAFETLTPDQEKMLNEKIIEQVKQALLAGILIPTSS